MQPGGPGLFFFGEEECTAAHEALALKRLSRYRFDEEGEPSGVMAFERSFASTIGVPHCIGMNSCTSALLAGMMAIGAESGDEILVPGYCFVADFSAIRHAGFVPVLVEVDDGLGMDPVDAASKISTRTRGMLVPHMLGRPASVTALVKVALDHGLLLIEDVAQSAGGSFEGRPLGSFGDISAFSLNIFKVFTAGDGGVLATRSPEIFARAFAIHDHGVRPYREGCVEASLGLGLNFRMHEIVGVIAAEQLKKLGQILARCRAQRDRLLANLALLGLEGAAIVPAACPAGDCGTTVLLRFDLPGEAQAVATELGSITLAQSGRHCYYRIPSQTVASARGSVETYPQGLLPRTDNLLSRTVAISVGVVDRYLGTGFGITPQCDERRIVEVAERIVAACCRLRSTP